MGLLADWQIRKDVKIVPFAEESFRQGVVSFGVSVLKSLKFSSVLNSMLNSPKFCHR